MDLARLERCNRGRSTPTVVEHEEMENSHFMSPTSILTSHSNRTASSCHELDLVETDSLQGATVTGSRRPSSVIAALRRPSQSVALCAAQAIMSQRRYMLGLMRDNNSANSVNRDEEQELRNHNHHQKRKRSNSFTTGISVLYALLLIALGVAVPVTEIVSVDVPMAFDLTFYLYLYLGSIIFILYMLMTTAKDKPETSIEWICNQTQSKETVLKKVYENSRKPTFRYGSFYLRLGAIAFGVGSMVHSGLEISRYFEPREDSRCHADPITPAARMLLTIVQIQFVFLNGKDLQMTDRKVIARFGLMHLIATDICEWLFVLVEETKHEIYHLGKPTFDAHINVTNRTLFREMRFREIQHNCQRSSIMGNLVQNVSPFLFPCTIEYSLICAVILFEMWKKIKTHTSDDRDSKNKSNIQMSSPSQIHERIQKFTFGAFGGQALRSSQYFSVDCANAHRGLFAGIVVIVMTIISLIMFFILNDEPEYKKFAMFEVNAVEFILHVLAIASVAAVAYKLKNFTHDPGDINEGYPHLELDTTLLIMAQTGVYIYCTFYIIGCFFMSVHDGLITEVFAIIQSSCQTVFILDAWWRRCKNLEQQQNKPGREFITFLIVANMGIWTMNSLEKNRAEFQQTHLEFFGVWTWTIITHISMPLGIFYRFHSSICLFHIWKYAYKMKTNKNVLFC